jgi:hypothetical protein
MAFRSKQYGMTDPFDLFTEVQKYQVRDAAGQITTLIASPISPLKLLPVTDAAGLLASERR